MDSILFSVNPKEAKVSDVVSHLESHAEVYFEVTFPVVKSDFTFPMAGFMHISGDKVRWVAKITDIIDFSRSHYEDPELAEAVKPAAWREAWRMDKNGTQSRPWKSVLVIYRVVPFEYDTLALRKYSGGHVTKAPQNYTRTVHPTEWGPF